MADVLFVAGIVLVAVAVGALAGPWWGVLAVGIALVALGVLTELDETPARPAGDDVPEPQR